MEGEVCAAYGDAVGTVVRDGLLVLWHLHLAAADILAASAGYGLVKSFQFVLLITLAQIPSYFFAGYLVEK